MTPKDRERYKELLNLAYPYPGNSIKDNVIKQIQAERKAKRLHRLVRYGSMAACFVLIMGVVIGIVPILNRSTKTSEADEHSINKAEPAMFADRCNDAAYTVTYSSIADAEENAEAEAPAEMYGSECETVFAAGTVAEDTVCTVHSSEHHRFSEELVNFIGAKDFLYWYESENAKDICGTPSVFTLIRDFEISRDVFEKLTESGTVPYNPDDFYPSEP